MTTTKVTVTWAGERRLSMRRDQEAGDEESREHDVGVILLMRAVSGGV